MNGSSGGVCSALGGDLNTTNDIIGNQLVHNNAGTAIGRLSVGSVKEPGVRKRQHRHIIWELEINEDLKRVNVIAEIAERWPCMSLVDRPC